MSGYKENSDGVNKPPGELGDTSNLQNPSSGKKGKKDLSHLKNPSSGNKEKKDLSNLQNPSSGDKGIRDLSNLKNPSSGKNEKKDLSNLQNPSSGNKEIKDLSNLQNPSSGKSEIKDLSHLQNPSSGKSEIADLSHLRNPSSGKAEIKPEAAQPADYTEWPLPKFAFRVTLGDLGGQMAFETMDGLGASIAKMEFRDGNSQKFFKQHRPTLTSFEPVTLKKGMFVGDSKLFDWFTNVSDGALFGDSRTVTIELCELEGNKLNVYFTWTLDKAYVTRFTPPSLDGGDDSSPAVEELELSYQSFTMGAGEGLLGSIVSGALGAVSGALSGSLSF